MHWFMANDKFELHEGSVGTDIRPHTAHKNRHTAAHGTRKSPRFLYITKKNEVVRDHVKGFDILILL